MKKIMSIAVLLILGTTSVSYASIDKNLKYGQRDKEVTELQEFLIDGGFLNGSSSGFFGLLTLKAVKTYQTSVGVSSTGYVGVLTRQKINDQLSLDLASSTQAEITETGTTTNLTTSITSGCLVGYLFNSITGQPCSITTTTPTIITSNDVCKNIEGIQTSVPSGMLANSDGNCFTPFVNQPIVTQSTNSQTQSSNQNNIQTQQTTQLNVQSAQTTDTTPPKLASLLNSNPNFNPSWKNGNTYGSLDSLCSNCLYLSFDEPVNVTFTYFDATNLILPSGGEYQQQGKKWQDFGDLQTKQTITSTSINSRHIFKFYPDSEVNDYTSDPSNKSQVTELNLDKTKKYYWSISAKDSSGNNYSQQNYTDTPYPSSWSDGHSVQAQ